MIVIGDREGLERKIKELEAQIALCKEGLSHLPTKEIEQRLEGVKRAVADGDVPGTPCEVFSRVVGYMRPVQNWNNGKKEEFAMRKTMQIEKPNRPCGC